VSATECGKLQPGLARARTDNGDVLYKPAQICQSPVEFTAGLDESFTISRRPSFSSRHRGGGLTPSPRRQCGAGAEEVAHLDGQQHEREVAHFTRMERTC